MTAAPLFDAIRAGDAPALEALLAADPALAGARDPAGVSALLTAKYHRQEKLAEALLAARRAAGPALDPFEAAAVGDVDRLSAALSDDPQATNARSPDGFTALHLACFFGQREACARLLAAGAPAAVAADNPSAVHPLHSAAAARATEVVALLAAGADPAKASDDGQTARDLAAPEVAELFA